MKKSSPAKVTVKFYAILRDKLGTGNVDIVGRDVLEVLKKLSLKYGSEFREEIFDDFGNVHSCHTLLLNDKTVDQKNPQKSGLKKGDVLHIFLPIAGGSDVEKIIRESKIIAIVGLSPKEDRPSNKVAKYLKQNGYEIIPVNPGQSEILQEKCYASLLDIPKKIDIVDIFRRSEDILPIVDDAIKIGAKIIWMQEGIVNEAAAKIAVDAGLSVIMDTCILKEHAKIFKEDGAQ